MSSSSISLHNCKLLIFSLILSSSLTKTTSVALLGCHGKCIDSNIPYSLGMFVLAPLIASTWIVWSQQKKKLEHHRMSLFVRNGGNILKKKLSKRKRSAAAHLKIYTAQDMKIATNNYSDSRSLMQGCIPGKFYRGTFENREAAVMMIPVPESKVEQFVDEVIFLSLPHRNLVRVSGCCLETSFPLLVYELHGDGSRTLSDCVLPRFHRARAAAGAARGLAYLRSRNPRGAAFLHGNVCGGNVLLDDSFDAKLFYAAGSGVDVGRDVGFDCDVYRFGAVLVEVVTRRRALDNEGNLATWLVALIEEDSVCDEVMRSGGDGGGEGVREVAAMAARCLSVRPEERPCLRELEDKLTAWIDDVEMRLTSLL